MGEASDKGSDLVWGSVRELGTELCYEAWIVEKRGACGGDHCQQTKPYVQEKGRAILLKDWKQTRVAQVRDKEQVGAEEGGKISRPGLRLFLKVSVVKVLTTATTAERILITCSGDQAKKWECLKCSVLHFQRSILAAVWDVCMGSRHEKPW